MAKAKKGAAPKKKAAVKKTPGKKAAVKKAGRKKGAKVKEVNAAPGEKIMHRTLSRASAAAMTNDKQFTDGDVAIFERDTSND